MIGYSLQAQGTDTLRTKSYKVKSEAVVNRLERELSLTEKQIGQIQKVVEEKIFSTSENSCGEHWPMGIGQWTSQTETCCYSFKGSI